MRIEIKIPNTCADCIFNPEGFYCDLLQGKVIETVTELGDFIRAEECPLINKNSRKDLHEQIKIIDE